MSATLDITVVDGNGIYNIVSMERVTLSHYKGRIYNRTDEAAINRTQSHRRYEDRIDENDARIIKEFPVQNILKLLKTGKRMKQTARWYGYGPDADTVELSQPTYRNLSFPVTRTNWTDKKNEDDKYDVSELYNRKARTTDYCSMQ